MCVRKAFVIGLALLLSINMVKIDTSAELPVEDFTHAVFGEEFEFPFCDFGLQSSFENFGFIFFDNKFKFSTFFLLGS